MDWQILHRKKENPNLGLVLVVEDESVVRDLWRGSLVKLGYKVVTAENAHEAVRMLNQHPDVALCDVHLPGASGLWLADQIRTLSPTTAIVLATGDRAIPPFESLRPGVVAYLVKPFLLGELKNAIEAGVRWSANRRVQSDG
jgi:CheY-like chemotaxis protein